MKTEKEQFASWIRTFLSGSGANAHVRGVCWRIEKIEGKGETLILKLIEVPSKYHPTQYPKKKTITLTVE